MPSQKSGMEMPSRPMARAARSAAPPRRPPPRSPRGTPTRAAQAVASSGQLEGDGQPVEDHPPDRLVLAEVEAEVAPGGAAEPAQVLLGHGLVEVELLANARIPSGVAL